MMDAKDIARKVEAVQELLTLKFGIKRAPLEKMLARAGRRIPKRMQAKIKVLIEAQRLAGHPKLARQMDGEVVVRAYDDVTAHLKSIDVADRRKGRILGLAGIVVFNLLFVIVAFVVWMWWRGYV
jgi:hypothetical protein